MIRLIGLIKKGALCAFLLLGVAIAAPSTTPNVTIPTSSSSKAHSKPSAHKTLKHSTHKKIATHTKPHAIATKKTSIKHHHEVYHHAATSRTHAYYQSSFNPTLPADFTTPVDLTASQGSVCSNAEAQLGKRYVWGGTSPSQGFDCSGFSQYIYKKEGIVIPRTALQQYDSLSPVSIPQPGDLVFFHTRGRYVSHVGIYLGDGYFIHSPGRGQRVRVDNLDSGYWETHYVGARRALNWNYMDNQFQKNSADDLDSNEDITDDITTR